MKSPQELSAGYRPDVDGLRAIAVLSVVLYHAGVPGFSGGFVGVDIFFVISGFLITGIIWRDLGRGRFSLADFYVRRVRRIFPALCAVLAVSSIAAFFLLIPADLISFGKSLKATVLFYSNFQLMKEVNYFDGPAIDKPLLHTWSLSVEEQFYAVWPLLLLALARLLPARRVLPAVVTIAAVSLLLAQLKLDQHPKDSFYVSYYRMWELMIGAALAIASPFFLRSRIAALSAAAGLAAITYAVLFYDLATPFPGVTALVPCLGAAFIIAGGGSRNPVSVALGFGPVRFFGLISYSLYLIHWPLLSFAHLYLNDVLDLPQRAGIVLMAVLLSYLSWRYIETPFRVPARGYSKTFFHGAVAAGVLCATAILFVGAGGFPSRVNEKVLAAEAFTVKAAKEYETFCKPFSLDGIPGACTLGDAGNNAYQFVLWGDSHAHHYAPALDALAKANKTSGILLSMAGCGPFLDWGKPDCRKFNKSVFDWMAKQGSLRVVILASRWLSYGRQLEEMVKHDSAGNHMLLSKTLVGLSNLPVSTVILSQVPEFKQNVSYCVARAEFYGRDVGSCSLEPAAEFRKHDQTISRFFEALQMRYSFTVVNPAGAFCDETWCHAIDQGEILMRDENHLTVAGALHVVPYIEIPGLSRLAGVATKRAEAPPEEPRATERQALAETKSE